MNVSLTPELEHFVQYAVQSGRYASASEVLQAALRLLEQRESSYAAQLQTFRAELDQRLASLDHGNGVDGEVVFERLRQKFKQHRQQSA